MPAAGAPIPNPVQYGIIDRLTADDALTTILTGGIWDRKVIRNTNPPDVSPTEGSTPSAFDPASPYRIRPCLSIEASPETADPTGPPNAMWTFPVLIFRCEPKRTEKQKIETAWWLAYGLLNGYGLTLPNGTGCRLRVIARQGFTDDPDVPNAVRDTLRLQGSGIWSN